MRNEAATLVQWKIEMTKTFLILSSCLAACFALAVPNASAQNLTDQLVTKVASPLVDNKVVDGLSIGYIEGGVVSLGRKISGNSEG